jgi:hypothetical protein
MRRIKFVDILFVNKKLRNLRNHPAFYLAVTEECISVDWEFEA